MGNIFWTGREGTVISRGYFFPDGKGRQVNTFHGKGWYFSAGLLAIYQVLFGWKIYKIIMKPTNAPTPIQPNPRQIRLKAAVGPLFPTANNFSWAGIDFIQDRLQETQPNQILANTLLFS